MRAIATLSAALGACWIALTAMSAAPNDLSARRSLEAGVLDRINYARQYPREYARHLREYRSYIRGGILFLPGDENGVYTREGHASVDDAIAFLERQAPLPALSSGALLALAAGDHARAQGPIGGMGHVSTDGASPGERVRRRGGGIYVGETISYGAPDGAAVVRNLIIDDGVRDRGHRSLIFDTGFRFAGVGCGGHARYNVICVVDYSGTPNGDPQLPVGINGASVFVYRGVSR